MPVDESAEERKGGAGDLGKAFFRRAAPPDAEAWAGRGWLRGAASVGPSGAATRALLPRPLTPASGPRCPLPAAPATRSSPLTFTRPRRCRRDGSGASGWQRAQGGAESGPTA